MDIIDYDFFFRQLKAGISIDETCFYFSDTPQESEHFVGFLPQYENPVNIIPLKNSLKRKSLMANHSRKDGPAFVS